MPAFWLPIVRRGDSGSDSSAGESPISLMATSARPTQPPMGLARAASAIFNWMMTERFGFPLKAASAD